MQVEATVTEVVMPPVDRLLALLVPDPTLLGRVLLAMKVWRGSWTRVDGFGPRADGWRLVGEWPGRPDASPCTQFCWLDTGYVDPFNLPDPFTDSAAVWDLETRELCGWRFTGTWHFFTYAPPGEDPYFSLHRLKEGPWRHDRRLAACLAALHKALHEDADGPLSVLIRPTLEKLEAKG